MKRSSTSSSTWKQRIYYFTFPADTLNETPGGSRGKKGEKNPVVLHLPRAISSHLYVYLGLVSVHGLTMIFLKCTTAIIISHAGARNVKHTNDFISGYYYFSVTGNKRYPLSLLPSPLALNTPRPLMARMQMTLCMHRSTHYRYILRAIKLLSRPANLGFCWKNFKGALFTRRNDTWGIHHTCTGCYYSIPWYLNVLLIGSFQTSSYIHFSDT